MKFRRILRVIGSGLLGGLIVGVLFFITSLSYHMIFFPDQPIKHVGWIEFLRIYAMIMSPGFLAGVVVSAFRLRPLYGALAAGTCGTAMVALLYAIGFLYYSQFILMPFLLRYAFSAVIYGVMSAIAGWICGFLSPRLEKIGEKFFEEPPLPDQFDFGS